MSASISHKDICSKAHRLAGRPLKPYEYVQLARMEKQYGIVNVYNALNRIEVNNGEWYAQVIEYLKARLTKEVKEFDIDSIITDRSHRMEDSESTDKT